jgi:ferritin-like metal-binding protein YciE
MKRFFDWIAAERRGITGTLDALKNGPTAIQRNEKEATMAGGTLRDLFEHELHDLRATEQEIIRALPELITSATSDDLKRALQQHLEQTRIHEERLELIFRQCGFATPPAARSGVESIIRAGSAVVAQQTTAQVRDAAIIDAAQHVEHYEIAGYGCARTFARQLDDDRSADLLQQTLDEEGAANKRLTQIAESGINEAASAGERFESGRQSRLRYVDIDDLPAGDRYRQAKIRNRSGDDLGRVDGFVLDEAGRPYYLVVDSGGFFVGRRYVVPVGRADFRNADRLFTIDLDKDTLKRYPEFHAESFVAMNDDEARRYEWRVLEAIDPEAARSAPSEWSRDEFPYYRQPEWFDAGTPATGPSRMTEQPATSPGEARIRSESDRREQIVARENPVEQERPPRERVRGHSDTDER